MGETTALELSDFTIILSGDARDVLVAFDTELLLEMVERRVRRARTRHGEDEEDGRLISM